MRAERRQLPRCPQLIQDLIAMVVDPATGRTDRSRSARHPRNDILHPDGAEIFIRHGDNGVARDVLGIAEYLLDVVNRGYRRLDLFEGFEHLRQVMPGDPAADDRIDLLDMFDAIEIGLE